MDTALGAAPSAEMAPGWAWASAVRSAAGAQWDLVSAQDGLSVADAAAGVWQVEYGLCVISRAGARRAYGPS